MDAGRPSAAACSRRFRYHGTIQRTTSSHQPTIWTADIRPVEIPGASRVSTRRARPEEGPPQAKRLRHWPGGKAETAIPVRAVGTPVPAHVQQGAEKARRDGRDIAAIAGDAAR